jgi:DGQHR domain-containing protein
MQWRGAPTPKDSVNSGRRVLAPTENCRRKRLLDYDVSFSTMGSDRVPRTEQRRIRALKVRQWMPGWNAVSYSADEHRRKPEPCFFIFSMPAAELRGLCGINRRQAAGVVPRAEDMGIQRQHDRDRSDEIARFVSYGYPWSTLSEAKRRTTEFDDLRKPGWLPTSIVINIIPRGDLRNGTAVDDADIVSLEESGDDVFLRLPYRSWSKAWQPNGVPPFEVIDGQHRLFAFDLENGENFDLPVVAFHGLDISWQAYLFWTINIKPKKINASLAFDLYPLLRGEDWLNKAEGHFVYRETRAQELTEALWSHPKSPWYDKINMLGERKFRGVTQSAWIRSLMATLIKSWRGPGGRIGGLFGGRLSLNEEVLGWSRAQQAAFLIFGWSAFRDAVKASEEKWATSLRHANGLDLGGDDPAFYGPFSLISTDQGVRGVLHVFNDLCFVAAGKLKLRAWRLEEDAAAADEKAVSAALKTIAKQPVASYLRDIASRLNTFDWRLSSAPHLTEAERRSKLIFRGSSGYKEIRTQLLDHVSVGDSDLAKAAKAALREVE